MLLLYCWTCFVCNKKFVWLTFAISAQTFIWRILLLFGNWYYWWNEIWHSSITSPFFLRRGKVKSSLPEVFLGKGVLKIYSKFTGEYPCRNHTSKSLNLLHIFKILFYENTYGGLIQKNFPSKATFWMSLDIFYPTSSLWWRLKG